jgi:hypothetical protein
MLGVTDGKGTRLPLGTDPRVLKVLGHPLRY